MRASLVSIGIAIAVPVGAFVAGYHTVAKSPRPDPIRMDHGIPVGVVNTPGGAVAAADNYLVSEEDALLSPAAMRTVLDRVWAPGARAAELAQPFPAAALGGRPASFSDLRLTAAVAANKLESYTHQSARIRVWHELTAWSPTITPTQRWSLDTVTLVWSSDRWLLASRSTAPDSQTPVPAWTSGGLEDRTSEAFGTRLAGMSGPYYEGTLP